MSKKNVFSRSIIYKWVAIVFCFFILLSAYPYVFCQFLPIPSIGLLSFVFLLIWSVYLISRRKILLLPFWFNIMVIFQCVCWGIFFVYHQDTSYLTRIFFIVIAYLSICSLYNTDGVISFLKLYNKWILIMAIGGCCMFLLVLLFSCPPFFDFTNLDSRVCYCFGLTCTNFYLGNVIRYSGFFDEPGAMAYWGVYALIFNKLFIHNNQFERLLMICLILTLSLAYYIQIILYILFFKTKNLRRFCGLFLASFIMIGAIYLSKDTPYDIYRFTFFRLEKNEMTGTMQGDNRSDLSEIAKKHFLTAPIMGIGAKKSTEIEYMADNPYEILAKDGIAGMIVTYFPLIIVFFACCKRRSVLCVIVILSVGYLQRPFHVDLVHPMMLYLMVFLIMMNEKGKLYKNNIYG